MLRALELMVSQQLVAPAPAVLVPMRLTAIRYGAAAINLYEFTPLDGAPLPAFSAGSHVDVHLPDDTVRQYSLCNPQGERHRYVLGVKRDLNSRGGSRFMHDELRVGTVLRIGEPRNNFALQEEAGHSVFIAGGIGVTPIACMVERLRQLGRSWELHYAVRRREEAVFLDQLAGAGLRLHVDEEHGGAPLRVQDIVAAAPPQAHLYCCGPAPMLEAFEAAAAGRPGALVHIERFTPAQAPALEGGFTVKLARSGRSMYVPPGHTIMDTLRAAGVQVQSSCEQGICGTCETRVLSGIPDHRDSLLSDEEKQANDVMMICCSGSKQDILVLDL